MRAELDDKSALAEAHLATASSYTDLAPLKSGDGTEWHALDIRLEGESGVKITEGAICPTSERQLKRSEDLNNIYVHLSPSGHITISCGVIDTEKKAKEFMAAVGWAIKARRKEGLPETPLRISMHQLNAVGVSVFGKNIGERKLVRKQRLMGEFINANLHDRLTAQLTDGDYSAVIPKEGDAVVSLKNRCYNGFTHVPGEEGKSHELNRLSVATQMGWLAADVKALATTIGFPEDEQAPLGKFLRKQEEVARLLKEVKSPNKRVKLAAAKQLKTAMKELTREAHALQGALEQQRGTRPELLTLRQMMRVGTQLFAIQTGLTKELGLPKLSAAQELALDFVADRMFGAATEINCKSGLDRAGANRAQEAAIDQKWHAILKEELGEKYDRLITAKTLEPADQIELDRAKAKAYKTLIDFVLDFEEDVKAMDAALLAAKEEQGADFNMDTWLEHPGQDFAAIHAYQVSFFAELMGVAIPITGRSCGIEGLKWHHDKKGLNPLEKNPHPLPYLPMFVHDAASDSWVQIVSDDRSTLTEAGNAILMRLSQARGG